MNRVIKFRAWNGHKMVDLKTITPLALAEGFNMDGLFLPFSDDFILMQFTGLHDKNGVEIYDGDTDITGIEIRWDEVAAAFICVRDGNFVDHLGEVSKLLLITGNIHEHKDLMK